MQIDEIGFRIKQAIGLTGYSVSTFCEETGRSRSSLGILISGRGGMPKSNCIASICTDLRMFNVECDADWIMEGKGNTPCLLDTDTKQTQRKNPCQKSGETNRIMKVLENQLSEKLDDPDIFDVMAKNFYIICKTVKAENVQEHHTANNMYVESSRFGIKDIVHIVGYCLKTQQLIVKLKKGLICMTPDQLDKVGEIIVMLNK